MVLKVKLNFPFNLKSKLVFIACLIFSWYAAIDATVIIYKMNGHCVLFGQIFEMDRVFINGYGCWFFIITEYSLGIVAIYYIVKSCMSPNYHWLCSSWSRLCVVVCFLMSLLMAVIFSIGFHSLCSSLAYTPLCNAETIANLEWKYFTPKYLDAARIYKQLERITISVWVNSFCWFWTYSVGVIKLKLFGDAQQM